MRFLMIVIVAAVASAQAPEAASKGGAASKAGTAPNGNAQNGKKIFTSYGCYQCHGYEAQGGQGTGPRLGPRPISLPAFTKYIRQPTGDMPPYTAKVVSEQDVADIYAFLQSRPQPPPAKSIPLLN